ncbi:hypothetical protein [Oceanobacillus saliphilus]|nr:hypothetical protein [Oceanobacillus saliphilus]
MKPSAKTANGKVSVTNKSAIIETLKVETERGAGLDKFENEPSNSKSEQL